MNADYVDPAIQPIVHQDPRDYRKELWIQIAVAVARAENAHTKDTPAAWADAALASFDRRFGSK